MFCDDQFLHFISSRIDLHMYTFQPRTMLLGKG